MSLYLAYRGKWPYLAYGISGVWDLGPNSGFSFCELCQEKMCPLGTNHLQLDDPGREENQSPEAAGIAFIPGIFSHPSTPASIGCFFATIQ
jgi:hypothetical protein